MRGRDKQDMEVEENEGNGGRLEMMNDVDKDKEEEEEVMRVRKLPRNKSDFFVRRGLGDEGDARRTRYGNGGGYHGRAGLKPCKCLKPNESDGQGKGKPHKDPSPSFS